MEMFPRVFRQIVEPAGAAAGSAAGAAAGAAGLLDQRQPVNAAHLCPAPAQRQQQQQRH